VADCVFCGIVAGTVPAFLVASSADGLAFLDIRPVFKGHVLVIPRDHIVELSALPRDLLPGYFGFVQQIAAAVPRALGAQGTFVAENNIVSQSVPHLHTHVVPRTKGDGLRGFFWPRHKYDSDDEAASFAERIGKEYELGSVAEGGRKE
jgi:histidine triad (HIT) family protein